MTKTNNNQPKYALGDYISATVPDQCLGAFIGGEIIAIKRDQCTGGICYQINAHTPWGEWAKECDVTEVVRAVRPAHATQKAKRDDANETNGAGMTESEVRDELHDYAAGALMDKGEELLGEGTSVREHTHTEGKIETLAELHARFENAKGYAESAAAAAFVAMKLIEEYNTAQHEKEQRANTDDAPYNNAKDGEWAQTKWGKGKWGGDVWEYWLRGKKRGTIAADVGAYANPDIAKKHGFGQAAGWLAVAYNEDEQWAGEGAFSYPNLERAKTYIWKLVRESDCDNNADED